MNGDGALHEIRLAFGHETVRFIDSFGEWLMELARMVEIVICGSALFTSKSINR